MTKQITIDDVQTAARITMWVEWRHGQDCPQLGKTWDEIFGVYEWASGVTYAAEFTPDAIDGFFGDIACHLEDAMDDLGL